MPSDGLLGLFNRHTNKLISSENTWPTHLRSTQTKKEKPSGILNVYSCLLAAGGLTHIGEPPSGEEQFISARFPSGFLLSFSSALPRTEAYRLLSAVCCSLARSAAVSHSAAQLIWLFGTGWLRS